MHRILFCALAQLRSFCIQRHTTPGITPCCHGSSGGRGTAAPSSCSAPSAAAGSTGGEVASAAAPWAGSAMALARGRGEGCIPQTYCPSGLCYQCGLNGAPPPRTVFGVQPQKTAVQMKVCANTAKKQKQKALFSSLPTSMSSVQKRRRPQPTFKQQGKRSTSTVMHSSHRVQSSTRQTWESRALTICFEVAVVHSKAKNQTECQRAMHASQCST